ncbi:Hypothetical protein R9X50_00302800 [Acrodontium crateriforme]|uniref:Uncharacterized protein n=1 Tax=Acrodontium crateriforme TaxID=150365 RepID=A0AAQ3M2J4_9PEZI|nr:Hypothetical protein R9X50_00302800 [Acrodontium crateriforme]
MPHATEKLTNGDKPASKFLSHVTSYPVVSDSIDTFKSHPYGKKSLELADGAYQKFGKPVEPYLETPYSYAKPYVTKADELADSGLGKVDERIPFLKEETKTIVDTGKSYVFYPFKVVDNGKQYVFKTWDDEYKRTASHNDRGPGLITSGLALISTELKIASDFFQAVADFLGPKYAEGKQKGADYVKSAEDTADHYKNLAADKIDELTKKGEQTKDQVKSEAEQAKKKASK